MRMPSQYAPSAPAGPKLTRLGDRQTRARGGGAFVGCPRPGGGNTPTPAAHGPEHGWGIPTAPNRTLRLTCASLGDYRFANAPAHHLHTVWGLFGASCKYCCAPAPLPRPPHPNWFLRRFGAGLWAGRGCNPVKPPQSWAWLEGHCRRPTGKAGVGHGGCVGGHRLLGPGHRSRGRDWGGQVRMAHSR